MTTDKQILVIGGAGFIGSHLVDHLQSKGKTVCVIDNFSLGKMGNLFDANKCFIVELDASNEDALRDFFMIQKINFDLVYNLAVVPLPHSLHYPKENIATNIKIVQNLCELQRQGYFKKMVHFSSSEVYGSCVYAPMGEDHPLSPSTPYAASKAAGDFICLSYVKTFGNQISIIRPFNNYGPRQNSGSYAGVIPITIDRILQGKTPQITGDGTQTRDYIYVGDTARAAYTLGMEMIYHPERVVGEVFNIASGHDIEIGWLVKKIAEIMFMEGETKKGFNQQTGEFDVEYLPDRPGDVKRHIANTLKAKDVLNFWHKVGMEKGLKQTVLWYLKK